MPRGTRNVRAGSFLGSVALLWLLGLAHTLCLSNAVTEARPDAYEEVAQKMKDFAAWLAMRGMQLGAENGCPVELAISDVEEGMDKSRSRPHILLRAARDITEGETIAHFSRDNMVHSKELPSPKRPKAGTEVKEEGEELVEDVNESWAPYVRAAAWILTEKAKGKDSEWEPYLSILPEHVPSTMFISYDALKLFEDQRLFSYTLAWKNILSNAYKELEPAAIANATLEEYLWAVSMVMSRAYGSHEPSTREQDTVEVEGSLTGPLVLIPLADLVNHYTWEARSWKRFPPNPSVATSHEDGGFVFRATTSIKKGEEIRACYGHFPNNELALVYGFVLDDNTDDGVILADGADETVAWFQKSFLEEGDVLQENAENTALDMVNEVEKVVEEQWAALEEHYKRLRLSIRAGKESNDTEEAERAWLFYSRAQFLLGSPQEQRQLAIWRGGGVDPRLLAGLTVLSFFAGEILSNDTIDRDAINMSAIANASINYGWSWRGDNCEAIMMPSGERYTQAMSLAGTLLLGYIKAALGSPTTIEEDQRCLMSVETCSMGEESGSGDEDEDEDGRAECDGENLLRGGDPKYDVIMALKYRISRKHVRQEAIDRLTASCSIQTDTPISAD